MRSLAGIFLGIFVAGSVAHAEGVASANGETGPITTAPRPAPKVPDFVPFVVDKAQDAAARAYLNEMKFKDAAPLWNWLNELEERAKAQWAADNAPKEAPK